MGGADTCACTGAGAGAGAGIGAGGGAGGTGAGAGAIRAGAGATGTVGSATGGAAWAPNSFARREAASASRLACTSLYRAAMRPAWLSPSARRFSCSFTLTDAGAESRGAGAR